MDEEGRARPPQVLVASASQRVRTALRALLETSTTWAVHEIPMTALPSVLIRSRASVVVLDLTEVQHAPAIPPAPVPPLVAITRTPLPPCLSDRFDAHVGVDDGVDAIVAAVDRVSR